MPSLRSIRISLSHYIMLSWTSTWADREALPQTRGCSPANAEWCLKFGHWGNECPEAPKITPAEADPQKRHEAEKPEWRELLRWHHNFDDPDPDKAPQSARGVVCYRLPQQATPDTAQASGSAAPQTKRLATADEDHDRVQDAENGQGIGSLRHLRKRREEDAASIIVATSSSKAPPWRRSLLRPDRPTTPEPALGSKLKRRRH